MHNTAENSGFYIYRERLQQRQKGNTEQLTDHPDDAESLSPPVLFVALGVLIGSGHDINHGRVTTSRRTTHQSKAELGLRAQ